VQGTQSVAGDSSDVKEFIVLTCFSFQNAAEAAEIKKKRTFRKFSYRGVDLEQYALPTP